MMTDSHCTLWRGGRKLGDVWLGAHREHPTVRGGGFVPLPEYQRVRRTLADFPFCSGVSEEVDGSAAHLRGLIAEAVELRAAGFVLRDAKGLPVQCTAWLLGDWLPLDRDLFGGWNAPFHGSMPFALVQEVVPTLHVEGGRE